MPSDVSYARSGDVAIAYQVVGSGPVDIVFVRGIAGDLLSTWDQPLLVRHVQGLAESGRVLMLDKRGTGLSDRVREVQSLDTAMDDIRAVMDAALRGLLQWSAARRSEQLASWVVSVAASTRPSRAPKALERRSGIVRRGSPRLKPRSVGSGSTRRLCPPSWPHLLVVVPALPTWGGPRRGSNMALARPTGVGRGHAHSLFRQILIEGAEEWRSAARKTA